jgi:hypothetical protein
VEAGLKEKKEQLLPSVMVSETLGSIKVPQSNPRIFDERILVEEFI